MKYYYQDQDAVNPDEIIEGVFALEPIIETNYVYETGVPVLELALGLGIGGVATIVVIILIVFFCRKVRARSSEHN